MIASAVRGGCYTAPFARSPLAHSLEAPLGKELLIAHKIFVGNLDYETPESVLGELFSQVGAVKEVFMPIDRATGRPRGLAFVEFEQPESIAAAIEKFDGHELGGRKLRVNEAEARQPRARPSYSDGPRAEAPRPPKPKGSRRNLRRRKRSL